jgi:hypothetical protein
VEAVGDEEDGTVGADLVQLGGGGRSALTDLDRVVALEPDPAVAGPGDALHPLQDPVERCDVVEVGLAAVEGGHAEVVVSVDEGGQDQLIAELDHLGALAGRRANLVGAADRLDPPIAHRHALRLGERWVHRQDAAQQREHRRGS